MKIFFKGNKNQIGQFQIWQTKLSIGILCRNTSQKTQSGHVTASAFSPFYHKDSSVVITSKWYNQTDEVKFDLPIMFPNYHLWACDEK